MLFNPTKSEKQVVNQAPDKVFPILVSTLQQAKGFKVKSVDEGARTVKLRTEMTWKSYGEDLSAVVQPGPDGGSEITLTSACQFGISDFGKNSENLKVLWKLLMEVLP